MPYWFTTFFGEHEDNPRHTSSAFCTRTSFPREKSPESLKKTEGMKVLHGAGHIDG